MIDLGLVRVQAPDAGQRLGSLFFNFGGPGNNPLDYLPGYAASWEAADPADPVASQRRRIAMHYDFVGVIPRGLRGGWTYSCIPLLPETFDFVPSHPESANIDKVDHYVSQLVTRCQDHPFYDLVSTEQNVHDLEYVRRAMGERRLDFFGFSYGSWLGTWYAARYPDRVGRMVLDSVMDITATFEQTFEHTLQAKDAAFERTVLAPVAADPGAYGLGTDVERLRAFVRRMHAVTRTRLSRLLKSPALFAAAVRLDDWYRSEPEHSVQRFSKLVAEATFSTDEATNERIRAAAAALVPALFEAPPELRYDDGPDGDSVFLATICNDTPWPNDLAHWINKARQHADRFVTQQGESTYYGLACARWGSSGASRPNVWRARDVPVLLVQSELDAITPVAGARATLAQLPLARLVVAEGSASHTVFGAAGAACVDRAVADYLVDGVLPQAAESSCRAERDASTAPSAVTPPNHDELGAHPLLW